MEKQYLAHESEERIRKLWAEGQVYRTNSAAPTIYAVDTPPPTVSGSLHIGHIFSYTQTDIMVRYQRLDGQEVMYPFGFDDNGLPTERFVEKQKGVSPHTVGRSAFIKLCLEETAVVEEQFKDLWQKIGLSVDWRLSYATIDDTVRRISQESFVRLYKAGYVYRKDEPSLYCTACRTTVAQAELDDHEEQSVFYDVFFADAQGERHVIATTRPEFLPSAVAVMFHPSDVRYQHLAGTQMTVPIYGNTVPVIADEMVIPEKGSGLVMCCTFGDTTDIAWYKKHSLPYRPAMGTDGRWLPSTGPLAGLRAKAARETIVEELRKAGLLGASRAIMHNVNVHERCKSPIEFLVLPQWFLKILPYKKELIEIADRIAWHPAHMKSRYVHWVEHITWDWCLSRQRVFGIPFPAMHCLDCRTVMLPELSQLPIDPQEAPWVTACTECGSANVVADRDVMDTWNTSSLTPFICEALRAGDPTRVFEEPWSPMAMRPQAHDIIRTWAFYTIAKSWMHTGEIPWRSIVISGHVLSASREKISKSKGNAVSDPHALLKAYPADVVRYWTASVSLGNDCTFSEQQFAQGNRLVVKVWNAFRFIAEHAVGAQLIRVDHAPEAAVHRWILHRATEAYEAYRRALGQFEYAAAMQAVEQFFWADFCDNYLELIKDQCFNPDRYAPGDVAETKAALWTVGLRVLQLFAPYIPYVTEDIYQRLYRNSMKVPSLHRTRFDDVQHAIIDQESVQLMGHVIAIVAAVRRLKTEHHLSLKHELATVTVVVTDNTVRTALIAQEQLIVAVVRAKKIEFAGDSSEPEALTEAAGDWRAVVRV